MSNHDPSPPVTAGSPVPSTAGAASGGIGLSLARLLQIFYAPIELFRDLRDRFSWFDWALPLLVTLVLTVVVGSLVIPYLDTETPARESMQEFGLTDEQIEAQLATQRQMFENPALRTGLLAFQGVTAVAFMAILGLIFWGAGAAMGARLGFGRTLSIVAYSWLVTVLQAVLLVLVLSGKEEPVRADRLSSVLITNPASFLSPSQSDTVLYAVVSSLNPFTLWALALVALGLAEAGRLSRGSAFGVAGVLFAIWLGLVGGWAAIF